MSQSVFLSQSVPRLMPISTESRQCGECLIISSHAWIIRCHRHGLYRESNIPSTVNLSIRAAAYSLILYPNHLHQPLAIVNLYRNIKTFYSTCFLYSSKQPYGQSSLAPSSTTQTRISLVAIQRPVPAPKIPTASLIPTTVPTSPSAAAPAYSRTHTPRVAAIPSSLTCAKAPTCALTIPERPAVAAWRAISRVSAYLRRRHRATVRVAWSAPRACGGILGSRTSMTLGVKRSVQASVCKCPRGRPRL